jgi:hypothetical protein
LNVIDGKEICAGSEKLLPTLSRMRKENYTGSEKLDESCKLGLKSASDDT